MTLRYLMIAVATLAIACAAPVSAQPKKPALTNAEALSMLQALRNLDGRMTVVKQPGDKETTIMVPWDFGSGSLRLRIAKNVTALAAIEKIVDDTRNAIIKELLKATPETTAIPEGSPAMESFRRQMGEVLNQPAAVDLSRIKASELRLDRNEIPVTAIAGMAAILDDDVTK